METSGPLTARDAVGPLRRLFLGPATRIPTPKNILLRYAVGPGALILVAMALANNQYLQDNRVMDVWMSLLLSLGAVLPVVFAVRRPVVGWRIAYPMLFLGTAYANAKESWPWAPVQIICFLIVMVLIAITEDTSVTVWVTALNIWVPFVYTDQANAIGVTVLLVVVAVLGDVVARRRQGGRALAEQAELTELERARRTILEERTRIAREMHDVVAHHMSMIAVQAETAPYRVTGLSEPAQQELATIATSARAALSDMRRLLGVLRADDEQALKAPQPGLDELPELVDKARRAGIEVSLEATDLDGVPEPVALAAYRIVQEALANTARHAPDGPVRVEARARDDRLELVVRNATTGDDPVVPAVGGHGLTGMRERAELLGGTLTAGPDGAGGFRVEASLPYEDRTRAGESQE